jgi:hypothetical protein
MQFRTGVNMQSRGLGDDIKKITSATKLDQLAKRIAEILDEDCGCDERQDWLNEQTKNWPMYKKRNVNNGNNK